MIKTLSTMVAAGAFALMLAPGAQAMSPAPLSTGTDVIQVAGGCGIGFHRGPYGGCRRNFARGPVVCRTWRGPYGRLHRVCR